MRRDIRTFNTFDIGRAAPPPTRGVVFFVLVSLVIRSEKAASRNSRVLFPNLQNFQYHSRVARAQRLPHHSETKSTVITVLAGRWPSLLLGVTERLPHQQSNFKKKTVP